MFDTTGKSALAGAGILLAAALAVGCSGPQPTAAPESPASAARARWVDLPAGAEGEEVRLGKRIFDETPKYAAAFVGNKLSCNDCHIQSGTAAYAAPMIDMANIFPMYNQRAGRVISMQERFQECFVRSENGRPLPQDGAEMKALTAYVNWLSRGAQKGQAYGGRGFVKLPPGLTGGAVKGRALYAAQCAGCHGADGAGVPPVLPAVWGPDSYNDGAGMNNPQKMAAFLIHNMPQNHPGTLTPQDAIDVATFVRTMPRPKFNQAYKRY